jgi:glycerophosphoryl diester phosphodiesterase
MLRAAAELAPDIRRSLLTPEPGRAWQKRARDVGAIGLHYDNSKIDAAAVATTAAAGFYVAVYTVNERARAEDLWRWGAASVITDDPATLLG